MTNLVHKTETEKKNGLLSRSARALQAAYTADTWQSP